VCVGTRVKSIRFFFWAQKHLRERKRGDQDEPVGRHQLPLRAASALEGESGEGVRRDQRLKHHDLLLLQCRQQSASPLSDEINNRSHRRRARSEGCGNRRVARPHNRQRVLRLLHTHEIVFVRGGIPESVACMHARMSVVRKGVAKMG
jgi:hypothetical protein